MQRHFPLNHFLPVLIQPLCHFSWRGPQPHKLDQSTHSQLAEGKTGERWMEVHWNFGDLIDLLHKTRLRGAFHIFLYRRQLEIERLRYQGEAGEGGGDPPPEPEAMRKP
jgi:hypothetical protein